jgi:hypothetical protein
VYLYWRIQTDLNEIESQMILRDPNLIREFRKWVRKNAGGLAIAEDLTWHTLPCLCLSQN